MLGDLACWCSREWRKNAPVRNWNVLKHNALEEQPADPQLAFPGKSAREL
jgi:hypothetical protein